MNLTIKSPNLNISPLIKSQDEKKNIETIYKEINKEDAVLKIEKEKDNEYKELKENLRGYQRGYKKFLKDYKKQIKEIEKEQRKVNKTQEEAKIRVKRYSLEPQTQEFNVLRKIKKTGNNDKKAVLKFYESYLKAMTQKHNLLKKLKEIDSSVKVGSEKEINKLKRNSDYLKKFDSKFLLIDLTKNNKDIPPDSLLSSDLFNLMKEKFQFFEQEIKNFGGWNEVACNQTAGLFSLFFGENPCAAKIYVLQGNQKTLEKTLEFKILLQLLVDMKQSSTKFDISYDPSN